MCILYENFYTGKHARYNAGCLFVGASGIQIKQSQQLLRKRRRARSGGHGHHVAREGGIDVQHPCKVELRLRKVVQALPSALLTCL